jgi:hypothetical protein
MDPFISIKSNEITIKTISKFCIINLIILFVLYTIIKINIAFQNGYNKEIDKLDCNCDCWDGKFKGEYLYATKQYKSIYFNMTWNTSFVVLWCIFHINLLINYLNYAFELFFISSLNYFVFVESWLLFYGIYYNWWCTFNYINDGFWSMIFTQIFFNITELISSYYIYKKINKKHKTFKTNEILFPLSIALMHILISLFSQGINNISQLKGMFQRDLAFLLTDFIILIHTFLDYLKLLENNESKHIIIKHFVKISKICFIILCCYFVLDIVEIKSW